MDGKVMHFPKKRCLDRYCINSTKTYNITVLQTVFHFNAEDVLKTN